MSEYAIKAENLRVQYPNFELAVDQFYLPSGYVMGLIGRNGAGKTTLIDALLDSTPAHAEHCELLGMRMDRQERLIKNQIGLVSDRFIFPNAYHAMKLIRRIGPFYDQFDESLFRSFIKQFKLPLSKPFGEFSAGMKAKLSIIFALAHHPKLMILDEPTANLDPVSRREVLNLLYEFMQQEDHSLLFSTHNTADLDKIADYVTCLENGRVKFSSSKETLMENIQHFRCEGKMPKAMKEFVLKPKATETGWEGVCTRASQLRHLPVEFTPLTLEEIMLAQDLTYEDF